MTTEKITNVRTRQEMNISQRLACLNQAGKIGIVYCEKEYKLVDNVVCELERSGIMVKRVIYPNDFVVSKDTLDDLVDLAEEIRFLIAVGGDSISQIASICGREYMLILTDLDGSQYLYPKAMLEGEVGIIQGTAPLCVLIDHESLIGDNGALARCYANIIGYCGLALDLKFQYFYSNVDSRLVDRIDRLIDKILTKKIVRNDSESLDRIISTNLELANLIADNKIDNWLWWSTRVAIMDYSSRLERNELMAVWSLYLMTHLSHIIPNYDSSVAIPNDIAQLAERIGNRTNIDGNELLRGIHSYNTDNIVTRDYVLSEYRVEMAEYIEKRYPVIKSAIARWRKLYDDAGQELSIKIDTKWLTDTLKESSILHDDYTLIKHLVLVGNI